MNASFNSKKKKKNGVTVGLKAKRSRVGKFDTSQKTLSRSCSPLRSSVMCFLLEVLLVICQLKHMLGLSPGHYTTSFSSCLSTKLPRRCLFGILLNIFSSTYAHLALQLQQVRHNTKAAISIKGVGKC